MIGPLGSLISEAGNEWWPRFDAGRTVREGQQGSEFGLTIARAFPFPIGGEGKALEQRIPPSSDLSATFSRRREKGEPRTAAPLT